MGLALVGMTVRGVSLSDHETNCLNWYGYAVGEMTVTC